MDKRAAFYFIIAGLLVAGIFVAGCSDSGSSGSPSPSSGTAVTTSATVSGAKYSAGDIIKNPKSSANSALLIIGYDTAADTYERAYIYPNPDGSWGYRMDTKTEKISRSTIEKVYTQKVTNKAVSAVPVKTPTPAVTPTEIPRTTATTSATVTATTSAALAPKILSIVPDKGKTGETVSITEMKGNSFVSGASVNLVKSGNTNISASSVNVKSSNEITCTILIPSNATTGYWDVLITNPGGQYHQYQNGFYILQGTSTTTTTTTTPTSSSSPNSPTVTSVTYDTVPLSGSYTKLYISGTNFRAGATAKLTSSVKADITASTCPTINDSLTQMICFFNIPSGSTGTWNVVVTNSDGTTNSLSNILTIGA